MKVSNPHPCELARCVQEYIQDRDMSRTALLRQLGYTSMNSALRRLDALLFRNEYEPQSDLVERLREYALDAEVLDRALAQDKLQHQRESKRLVKAATRKLQEEFVPHYYLHHAQRFPSSITAAAFAGGPSRSKRIDAPEMGSKLDEAELIEQAQAFIRNELPMLELTGEAWYGERRYIILWYEHNEHGHKAIAFDLEGHVLTREVKLMTIAGGHDKHLVPIGFYPYVDDDVLRKLGVSPPINNRRQTATTSSTNDSTKTQENSHE